MLFRSLVSWSTPFARIRALALRGKITVMSFGISHLLVLPAVDLRLPSVPRDDRAPRLLGRPLPDRGNPHHTLPHLPHRRLLVTGYEPSPHDPLSMSSAENSMARATPEPSVSACRHTVYQGEKALSREHESCTNRHESPDHRSPITSSFSLPLVLSAGADSRGVEGADSVESHPNVLTISSARKTYASTVFPCFFAPRCC